MPVETRDELATITPVVHGAVGPSELATHGLVPETVVDFSVSTNPLGPPPAVLAAVQTLTAGSIWRYPEPAASPLRRALAERLELDPEQVVAGNGSSELIWSLALAYARPSPSSVLVCEPAFGEYARASRLLGATIAGEQAAPETGFHLDIEHLARRIRRERPRLVWLGNPNNPTGIYVRHAEVVPILEGCIAASALLVVDEAYLPFVDGADSLLDLLPSGHLFLLRSLTKDYALAGLRLGYGLGTPEISYALRLTQAPWSVNAAAQAAGLAALTDADYLERSRAEVRAARAALVTALEELGLRVTPPAANFILVEVGDATGLRARLCQKGYVVRDCTSFGLPRHVRIGVRTQPECDRLIQALRELLRAGS